MIKTWLRQVSSGGTLRLVPNDGNDIVRFRRPKWILAGAAAGLLLGAAVLAQGLLGSPTAALIAGAPGSGTAPSPGVAVISPLSSVGPFPPSLAADPALAAPLSAGAALPSPLPAGALLAPPQQMYRGYDGYRDQVLRIGGGLREFYFTRGIYSSGGGYGYGRRRNSWATDYPKADRQFMWGLKRLTNIDAYDYDNAVLLTDPDLRRYPFLYMLEVGSMQLTPPEVEALRSYVDAGGFVFIDDFWGTWEWQNFEWEIHQVFPEYEIVELPLDHPLFSQFYVIEEILQVPNVGNGRSGGSTHEQDGYVPHVRAIFDDDGRLLVLINWNTDLGDAWEWAEDPYYPLPFSNFAYQMGVNAIIYAMSH
jgi:hypothetical protein